MSEIKVIDVSYCQQGVDYKRVKAAGVGAVIIRNGYLGKTDTEFDKHMQGAIAAGLDVGTYTYIMANTPNEAVREATETVARIAKYKGKLTYPVFCDMESEKYYKGGFTQQSRTAIIEAFCRTIERAGYYAALYTNPAWIEQWTLKSRTLKYDIWLAAWTGAPTKATRYKYNQKMWQWGTDKVSGISGDVDCDICYVDYPAIIRAAGKNFLSAERLVTITATKTVTAAQAEAVKRRLEAFGCEVSVK